LPIYTYQTFIPMRKRTILTFVLLGKLLFATAQLVHTPFCANDYFDPNQFVFHSQLRSGAPEAKISYIDNIAVVMEFNSVYDVHPTHDAVKYPNMRVQPGGFDLNTILPQLRKVVTASEYDFVLMYSLREVPGWINSGGRLFVPAKNIGQPNSQYTTTSTAHAGWTKLRACPHMNDLAFLTKTTDFPPNYNSTLTAFHEMGHYFGVQLTANASVGPATWDASKHPIAWLSGCCAHWSWNWTKDANGTWPGILYSGATDPKFNAYDLYSMGLMDYTEASKINYTIYENNKPTAQHTIKLDDFIAALKLANDGRYEGDGKRIPSLDPKMKDIKVLLVVIKGKDEVMDATDLALIRKLAADMPNDWKTATWGRSQLTAKLLGATPVIDLPAAQFSIFPNPVQERVLLQAQNALPGKNDYQYLLRDLHGRLVLSGKIPSSGSLELDLAALSAGFYSLQVRNERYQYTAKLVKQ
jgi:hypothetical protein